MFNQSVIKRRKIETVFLGTINQVVNNAVPKNNLVKHQTEETIKPQLENDNNSCEFQSGTPLNQCVSNISLKNCFTAENEYRCSVIDSTGDYSTDSDFFAMHKPKAVVKFFIFNIFFSNFRLKKKFKYLKLLLTQV